MDKLKESLEALGFTSLESQIYLALLEGQEMSPYHLAKKIQISRPSIYNSLEHMYDKGYVDMVSLEKVLYRAQEPRVLLAKMSSEFNDNFSVLSTGLEDYIKTSKVENNISFKGFDTMIEKAKILLVEAEDDIYINADFNLDIFREEFKALKKKNIRVIVFSFHKLDMKDMDVELYCHQREVKEPTRLMIAENKKIAMIADHNVSRGVWKGNITNNPLMISIICEHIHNDIYLLKIREKYGSDYDIYKAALLHSAFEEIR